MPKLPRNVKPKKLIELFQKRGFKIVGKRGSHFRLKHLNGNWTQVAVHPKPIPQGTLRKILNQSGLKVEGLLE
ncbi:MAG: type II toxin-antitoxin system HicA family toxin [Patescibacteria group bacterium]